MVEKVRNDLTAAVPKFCLALEEHRRTNDGRVRSSQEFLTHYFPHDATKSEDRVFPYVPNDVRGPILATWGIRGMKAALRDTDEKVQSVVHDALVAGDLDHTAFESGLTAETLIRWAPLSEWWTFWRGGKLSKIAIQKALVTAYELALFDARWFLDTIDSRGGKLKGTDVLADGLTKDDLTEWIRKVHETGDGSPKGLVAALGWDKIVAKTTNDVLIALIDAMVTKIGLVKAAEKAVPAAATSSSSVAASAATASSSKATEPPSDMDWSEGDVKPATATASAAKSGAFSAVENMPTVNEKGETSGTREAMPNNDDSPTGEEVIMIDEDEAPVPERREEPPTSPRIEVASPVDAEEPKRASSGRMSQRPAPATPPAASVRPGSRSR